jgi:antitoxin MazE
LQKALAEALLVQLGLKGKAEMLVEKGALLIRKPFQPRQGWAQASQRIAADGDDALIWPEFANQDDETLEW